MEAGAGITRYQKCKPGAFPLIKRDLTCQSKDKEQKHANHAYIDSDKLLVCEA